MQEAQRSGSSTVVSGLIHRFWGGFLEEDYVERWIDGLVMGAVDWWMGGWVEDGGGGGLWVGRPTETETETETEADRRTDEVVCCCLTRSVGETATESAQPPKTWPLRICIYMYRTPQQSIPCGSSCICYCGQGGDTGRSVRPVSRPRLFPLLPLLPLLPRPLLPPASLGPGIPAGPAPRLDQPVLARRVDHARLRTR